MNAQIGLDGKSVLIGGGLVLAGMVAAHSGAIVPLALFGIAGYLVGKKKGWWSDKQAAPRRGPFSGPPAMFEEWHRQTHAYQGQQVAYPHAPQPPAPPRDAETRSPVTEAPGYQRTVGEHGDAAG